MARYAERAFELGIEIAKLKEDIAEKQKRLKELQDEFIHISLDCESISPKPVKGKSKYRRQDQKDMKAVQSWALLEIEKSAKTPTLIDLAHKAAQAPPGNNYSIRTLQDWMRLVHPDFTPGQPGRKKSK